MNEFVTPPGASRPLAGRGGGPASITLALILATGMALFLLLPVGLAIRRAFVADGGLSLYWFGEALGSKVLIGNLTNSAVLACTTTALCLAIAVPLALLRARCRFAGQGVLGVGVLLPMILPPFVGALSMRRLFSQFGVVNQLLERIGVLDFASSLPPDWLGGGFAGVVFLQSLHLFPILYLNASAALANVDPTYSQAARNLGAGPVRTFFRVTLPLMRPGLFAGGTIVFIWAFTDVGTPLILNYTHLIPVTIFKDLARADTGGLTYSLVFVMLTGSVGLYVLGKFLFGRAAGAESSKASIAAETRRLGFLGTLGAWALFGVVILLAVLPHVGVVLTGFARRWVSTILPEGYTLKHIAFVVSHPATYHSLLNSLKYAGLSTGFDIALGSLAAWLIIRARVRGRNILDGLMMLPLAVPGMILAAGYVALTATNWVGGPLGGWLESIGPAKNPFWILVIAYTVRRIPFVVRGVSAGLQQVPLALEEAARNLGSSRAGAFWRITLPLIAANIVAAGVLTFAFAMLEVSDSLILAQKQEYYPITKQLYELATSTGSPETGYQAAALGVYGMVLLAGTLAVAGALLGRRLGAIFRA
ncbi:MAG TPA: iron ABC transporter permease [Phycisphaerae bacterium]|nr:iron ABC transporter permease [Phycisphaerae bacterium]